MLQSLSEEEAIGKCPQYRKVKEVVPLYMYFFSYS